MMLIQIYDTGLVKLPDDHPQCNKHGRRQSQTQALMVLRRLQRRVPMAEQLFSIAIWQRSGPKLC